MAYRRRSGPGEPTRRFPWVVLALALLVLVVVGAFYLLNRTRTVNLTVEPSPTPNPLAQAGTAQAGPPPTFTPPPAIVQPTVTPPPTPTRVPAAASPSGFVPGPATQPAATPLPAATSVPPAAAAPPPAGGVAAAPTEPGSSTAVPPAPTAAATAPPTPTPFAGQVAAAGGVGNTRSDLDSAYGPPTGQTPDQLVAYRKGTIEYHVGYTPDPPRAWLIEELVPQNTQMSFEQAMPEARKLFPRDTQSRGAQPEGSNQFVVERFRSPTLGEAIPPEQFQQRGGNPGDFLAVYARDPAQAGRVTRIIVGIGDDPNVLLAAR